MTLILAFPPFVYRRQLSLLLVIVGAGYKTLEKTPGKELLLLLHFLISLVTLDGSEPQFPTP
jgi:hypothetical protein